MKLFYDVHLITIERIENNLFEGNRRYTNRYTDYIGNRSSQNIESSEPIVKIIIDFKGFGDYCCGFYFYNHLGMVSKCARNTHLYTEHKPFSYYDLKKRINAIDFQILVINSRGRLEYPDVKYCVNPECHKVFDYECIGITRRKEIRTMDNIVFFGKAVEALGRTITG